VRVIIDSFHDRRTRFEFGVNRRASSATLLVQRLERGYRLGRRVGRRGHARQGRWRAEFKIPFSQLRFHPAESATFGLAVVRMVGRLNETDYLAAHLEERDRCRVVVRGAHGLAVESVREAARGCARTPSRR
jgi:hypothetical protein